MFYLSCDKLFTLRKFKHTHFYCCFTNIGFAVPDHQSIKFISLFLGVPHSQGVGAQIQRLFVQSIHQKRKLTLVARDRVISDNKGFFNHEEREEKKVMGENQDNQYKKPKQFVTVKLTQMLTGNINGLISLSHFVTLQSVQQIGNHRAPNYTS